MLTTLVGATATCLSGWAQPVQAMHVWKHRRSGDVVSGVSLLSIILITTAASCWIGYGFRHQGVFAGILAGVEVGCQVLIVTALTIAGVLSFRKATVYGIVVIALLSLALCAPVSALGMVGAALSVTMFVPQAVKMWKNRHNPAAFAVSPVTGVLMVVANVLWLFYGVLLRDIWLTVPCVVHIVSAVTMCVVSISWWKKARVVPEPM